MLMVALFRHTCGSIAKYYPLNQIDYPTYQKVYEISMEKYRQYINSGSGGSYYNTKKSNLSKTFAKAVINSTLEGQILYDDAFRLLNVSHGGSFNTLMEMYDD